ncbi:MAG TPA: hypothetical protein PKM59_10015 [Thermodesulfobacteriota bacterium]|nr:hypothetical protein [Thermodesulfobacteriota bacterium]
MEKKKILNDKEINEFLDNYFTKLESDIMAVVNTQIKAETKLFTADATLLSFPDDIQESSQIEEGTSPVKIDGKLADGKFTMPDGVVLEIKEGKVTKIIQPSVEQIAAMIRRDMKAFRSQLKAFMNESGRKSNKVKVTAPAANRSPFKAKRQPTGKRVPFHTSNCK